MPGDKNSKQFDCQMIEIPPKIEIIEFRANLHYKNFCIYFAMGTNSTLTTKPGMTSTTVTLDHIGALRSLAAAPTLTALPAQPHFFATAAQSAAPNSYAVHAVRPPNN